MSIRPWLIEHPDLLYQWWRERPAAGYGWRYDANEATRYATHEECEAAIERIRRDDPTWEGRATLSTEPP